MVARFGYFLCPCKFTAMNTINNASNSSLDHNATVLLKVIS